MPAFHGYRRYAHLFEATLSLRWAFVYIGFNKVKLVLDVEFEEEDVAILDDIFFAFGT